MGVLEYVWWLDSDAYFPGAVEVDPFQDMRDRKLLYGWSHSKWEGIQTPHDALIGQNVSRALCPGGCSVGTSSLADRPQARGRWGHDRGVDPSGPRDDFGKRRGRGDG